MLRIFRFASFVLICMCFATTVALGAPRYTITELCTPASFQSDPWAYGMVYGINNNGQVAGEVRTGGMSTAACVWDSNGTPTQYSATLDISQPGQNAVYGINDNGVAVGEIGPTQVEWQAGSASWENLSSNSARSMDINNAGQVVGFDGQNIVMWQDGVESVVDQYPGYSRRSEASHVQINENGNIVGTRFIDDRYGGSYRASYWDGTSVVDLGSLEDADKWAGHDSYGYALNDLGQVVGTSDFGTSGNGYHSFMWQNGQMHDLGALGNDIQSFAFGINNKGQIVGYSFGARQTAFLYENGQMVDLNSCITNPTWHLAQAYGINENGQIVGHAIKTVGGVTYDAGFLLTPEAPEPSSLLALFGGLAGIGGMIRLKRKR